MKNKTRDEDDANQSLFSAAGVRPNHPFSKTTHFADISKGIVSSQPWASGRNPVGIHFRTFRESLVLIRKIRKELALFPDGTNSRVVRLTHEVRGGESRCALL
jgi:hypothetical protein